MLYKKVVFFWGHILEVIKSILRVQGIFITVSIGEEERKQVIKDSNLYVFII